MTEQVRPSRPQPLLRRLADARLLAPLARWARATCAAHRGNWKARKIQRTLAAAPPAIEQALEAWARRWPSAVPADQGDEPVFVLSAGWRSGSTWLQRLLMSSGQVLIWGEPYDRAGLVQGLARQVLPISDRWPPAEWIAGDAPPAELADEWVATLSPPPAALVDAHRAFFRTLFAEPARARGCARWGLKETRLGVDHALYLRFLFPRARFVFLIRDPLAAYQSYRAWGTWFYAWPDRPVFTAREFGRVWATLARDFAENHKKVDGLLVRYEDLRDDPVALETLSRHLALPISADRAARRIAAPRNEQAPIPRGEPMPAAERRLLVRAVAPVAADLGYRVEP